MNASLSKPFSLVVLLGLLTSLAGCQQLGSIRMEPDRPGDLGALMLEQEYGRAEQLLVEHPNLDTPATRADLNERISAYETLVLSDASAREASDDLYGANELLVVALRKLPNSVRLNEYQSRLDAERAERLKENERRELLADAEYYVAQQEIYREQLNLEAPSLLQRWKNRYNQQQADELVEKLLACGETCLQGGDLELAKRCLNYARLINDTPEVSAALSQLEAKQASLRIDDQKKIRIVQQRREKKLARIHRNKTQEVLEQTQRALDDNDLPAAHHIFLELPKSATASREVEATRARLNKAIQAKVRELTVKGDRQYRADRVSHAIRIWERAYELDPDNQEVGERLERARKVLARLEELRSKKRAPAGQIGSGT
jgi:hypothetical protein